MLIACVDTETSGLEPGAGELVEVAYVLWSSEFKTIVRASSVLVKTEHGSEIGGIPPMVAMFGGIDRPLVFPAHDVVMAHQADFDRKWLPELNESTWVCSMTDVEWPKKPKGKANVSLVSLLLAHDLGVVEAHRALPDAWNLARLLTRVSATHDIEALMKRAMRPKTRVVALVTYANRNQAKEANFQWDDARKEWWRMMPPEDTEKLGFRVRI